MAFESIPKAAVTRELFGKLLAVFRTNGEGNADLIGAIASTCSTGVAGQPFIILSSDSFARGATLERELRFSNPSLEEFSTRFHIYSGPGKP